MAQEIFRVDDNLPEADRRVLTVIRKTLLDYEPLRATRPVLDVSVREGLVHLEGRVRTSAIKEIAELLVIHLPQVRAVRNDLVADPEVVRAVADALADDPEIGPACLIVDCRDGEVIMIGDVATEELAYRAVAIASTVPIVGTVRSHIKVVPPVLAHSVNGSANGAVAVAIADEPDAL
jgi:osmotically-inducible protein OsmY